GKLSPTAELTENEQEKFAELKEQIEMILTQENGVIKFYHHGETYGRENDKDYYEFTNFASYPFYFTSQASDQRTPFPSRQVFRQSSTSRKISWFSHAPGSWENDGSNAKKIAVMKLATEQKFRAHDELKAILLATNYQILIENTASDARAKKDSC
ncbi:8214_t:CDS:2, partial [Ambispora gerdemannii]